VNVRLLGAAQADATDAEDWYEQQANGLGSRFRAAVDDFVADLSRLPRRHARVPRGPAGREIRRGLLAVFPLVVVYDVSATEVVILAITHARAARQPWRGRLS
jgi:plasmid stabilization system protein ParE